MHRKKDVDMENYIVFLRRYCTNEYIINKFLCAYDEMHVLSISKGNFLELINGALLNYKIEILLPYPLDKVNLDKLYKKLCLWFDFPYIKSLLDEPVVAHKVRGEMRYGTTRVELYISEEDK